MAPIDFIRCGVCLIGSAIDVNIVTRDGLAIFILLLVQLVDAVTIASALVRRQVGRVSSAWPGVPVAHPRELRLGFRGTYTSSFL